VTEPSGARGLFVTFEGVEGAGKSTQVARLRSWLEGAGYEVVATREPGGTPLGEVARELTRKPALARRFFRELTGAHWQHADPLAELFLMSAARAQLVGDVLLPALARGAVVLLDRYADSTLAYQGYGRGLDLADLRRVNDIATRSTRPALTVLIDLPPSVGLLRKRGERGQDAIGTATIDFHERVRGGYLALAAAEPARWVVIPGRLPQPEIEQHIRHRLAPLLEAVTARDAGAG
jgi:dTMP kinase